MKTLEVLEKVLRGKRIKPNTQRHYREALSSLARYSEDWPVSGIVINEWVASLEGRADASVKMWFDFVKAAGKYIQKAYKIDNPCEDADVPKVAKKRRRYFSPDELVLVLAACKFGYDRELILTLIDSTCRIGKLVGLKGGDVGQGFIKVKGKTGERQYRLDIRICGALKRLAGSDDGLVFKAVDGEPLNADSLTSRLRRVIVRAGLKGAKLGAHTIRHSGASLVAQETRSALVVKALLQHDSIDTSMLYIHDAEDVIQQSISPLRLVIEKAHFGGKVVEVEPKQLTMGGEVVEGKTPQALVPVNGEFVEVPGGEVVENVVSIFDDMFPEIPDRMVVRSVLRSDDLRLIRWAFLECARCGVSGDGIVKARDLMRRMLRKGGSKFYRK